MFVQEPTLNIGEIELGECGIRHVELDYARVNNELEEEGHEEDKGYQDFAYEVEDEVKVAIAEAAEARLGFLIKKKRLGFLIL